MRVEPERERVAANTVAVEFTQEDRAKVEREAAEFGYDGVHTSLGVEDYIRDRALGLYDRRLVPLADRLHITQQIPRQDSLTDQLEDVYHLACRVGCYDAADWLWKQARGGTGGT